MNSLFPKIIGYCSDNFLLKDSTIPGHRQLKSYTTYERDSKLCWYWDSIDSIIKENLGNEYKLTHWLIVIRYDVGDYFSRHIDVEKGNDSRILTGIIQMSENSEFEGGEFLLEDNLVTHESGKLYTHGVDVFHELKPITKGTRWALHCGIGKDIKSYII